MLPRTVVGRWLLAAAAYDPVETRDYWLKRLNGGQPGFNGDEPMFVLAACERAMHTYFGRTGRECATPEDFASAAVSASPSLRVPADKLRRFARAALEQTRRPDDMTPGEAFLAAGALFAFASRKLAWDRAALEDVITDAELRVETLGYAPPHADAQTG